MSVKLEIYHLFLLEPMTFDGWETLKSQTTLNTEKQKNLGFRKLQEKKTRNSPLNNNMYLTVIKYCI